MTECNKFGKLVIVVPWLLFGYCFLVIGVSPLFALDLDSVKVDFLSGNYAATIKEGENILADANAHSENMAELYYLLGLSYLKEGDYLRASDIFEIILKEFKADKFDQEARLGLADVYFLKGDYDKSEFYCSGIVTCADARNVKASAYYLLTQIALKRGLNTKASGYLGKLKSDYPLNPELMLNKEITGPEFYHTVQVGSFSGMANGKNLVEKLQRQGYPAYLEEGVSKSRARIYRVRVGKFIQRQDAKALEKKLSRQGYPTRIYP